jgi:hypothetical protein
MERLFAGVRKSSAGSQPILDKAEMQRCLECLDRERHRIKNLEFAEGILDEAMCVVCLGICHDPHGCERCSAVFCAACILQMAQGGYVGCPQCRGPF